jgi:hypothetical protein
MIIALLGSFQLYASLYRYDYRTPSDKYREASSAFLSQAYDMCHCKEPLERRLKQEYRELTTKTQRKIIGNSYILLKTVLDRQVKYEWTF